MIIIILLRMIRSVEKVHKIYSASHWGCILNRMQVLGTYLSLPSDTFLSECDTYDIINILCKLLYRTHFKLLV